MRVFAQELGGRGAQVGEVAASAAGDTDFFRHLVAVVEQQDFEAALARLGGAKQASGTRAHHDNIEFRNHISLLCRLDRRKTR